jgi:hypothetical protein
MRLGVLSRRALAILTLAAVLVAGVGCGGGGGSFEGTLEVVNQIGSTDFIDEIEVEDRFSLWGDTWFGDVFPGEAFAVDLFPSSYDVTLFWGDGLVEQFTVNVYDDEVTVVSVAN